MTQQQEIVAAVRQMIGTPWVHQGRSEDGVDCAGLVIKAAHELGLIDWDIRDYERKASMAAMLDICREHLIEIRRADLAPGDLIILRFRETNHLGVMGDYPHGGLSIIHAQATHPRRVGENRFCDEWMQLMGCRIAGCFRFPEKAV